MGRSRRRRACCPHPSGARSRRSAGSGSSASPTIRRTTPRASIGPGVAYADLRHRTPDWLLDTVRHVDADVVVVSPHWGPNMVAEPRRARSSAAAAAAATQARRSSRATRRTCSTVSSTASSTTSATSSTTTPVDPYLRNELGLLWLVTFDGLVPYSGRGRPTRTRLLPHPTRRSRRSRVDREPLPPRVCSPGHRCRRARRTSRRRVGHGDNRAGSRHQRVRGSQPLNWSHSLNASQSPSMR